MPKRNKMDEAGLSTRPYLKISDYIGLLSQRFFTPDNSYQYHCYRDHE